MKALLKNWLRQRKIDAAIRRARTMLKEGRDPDEIIGHLKLCGFSQGMSSVTLKTIGVGDGTRCKSLVVESSHWADVKNANIALQQSIDDYLDQEG